MFKVEIFVCGFLANILRMKKFETNEIILKKKSSYTLKKSYSKNELNDFCSKSLLANILNTDDNFGVIGRKINCFKPLHNENFDSSFDNSQKSNILNYQTKYENAFENCFSSIKSDIYSLKKNLNSILKELRVVTLKIKEEENNEKKSLNWKFAAMVIDRLCMVFFTVTFLISTSLVLFTSENFFKSSNQNAKF